MAKQALTASQAARALGMTPPAIRVALSDGRLRGYKASGKWHVTMDSIKAHRNFREVRALRAENRALRQERDYLDDLVTGIVTSMTGDQMEAAVQR